MASAVKGYVILAIELNAVAVLVGYVCCKRDYIPRTSPEYCIAAVIATVTLAAWRDA